jgi:hypothetical protein
VVSARLLGSSDTRVLLAGLAAFIALVVYVGVAFTNTHATPVSAQTRASEVAPWIPVYGPKLDPVPLTGGGFAVRVTPTSVGSYGALVSTVVYKPPPGRRFVISLGLRGSRPGQAGGRGSRPGRIGVFVNELGLGGASALHAVNTTVPAKESWHQFTFRGRVEGRRLSLAVYVYRNIFRRADLSRTWFEVRDLTATLLPR